MVLFDFFTLLLLSELCSFSNPIADLNENLGFCNLGRGLKTPDFCTIRFLKAADRRELRHMGSKTVAYGELDSDTMVSWFCKRFPSVSRLQSVHP